MNEQIARVKSLRDYLGNPSDCSARFLWSAKNTTTLDKVLRGTSLGGLLQELSGRSVVIFTQDQFAAALAMIELDGVARRLIICSPDLSWENLSCLIAKAGVDAIVSDQDTQNVAP